MTVESDKPVTTPVTGNPPKKMNKREYSPEKEKSATTPGNENPPKKVDSRSTPGDRNHTPEGENTPLTTTMRVYKKHVPTKENLDTYRNNQEELVHSVSFLEKGWNKVTNKWRKSPLNRNETSDSPMESAHGAQNC